MWHQLRRFFNFHHDQQVKLRNRPVYASRVFVAGITVLLICALVPPLRKAEWIFGALGVVAGVGYFLFQQHLNETQFFAELFERFNARYNDMNEDLQRLRESDKPWTDSDKLLVIDYFNLCAEEFLFYDAGYIDGRVWRAWNEGMQYYAEDRRFAEVWLEQVGCDESGVGSYYDFPFPISAQMREELTARDGMARTAVSPVSTA